MSRKVRQISPAQCWDLHLEQLEAALHGELQIYIDGHAHPMELNRNELAAYEHAKQRRFVVEEDESGLLDEAYHQYCATAQICWVRIVFHPHGDGCRINEVINTHNTLAWTSLTCNQACYDTHF